MVNTLNFNTPKRPTLLNCATAAHIHDTFTALLSYGPELGLLVTGECPLRDMVHPN